MHRLVLLAFTGPASPGEVGRHMDGDPSNNRACNLAWGSPAENTADMLRMGRQLNARKTHCKHNHEFTEANTYTGRGQRECRACGRERWARRRRRMTGAGHGAHQPNAAPAA
nr:HNH endonuclease [Blastococcus xanthinilyticus]